MLWSHSLEIAEALRGVEGRYGDRGPVYTYFGKKHIESLLHLSSSEFKLAALSSIVCKIMFMSANEQAVFQFQ